jgi:hypothetical protein
MVQSRNFYKNPFIMPFSLMTIPEERMNETFPLLLSLIIMTAVAIAPCCMAISPPGHATYLGTYSGEYSSEFSALPSITFSPNNGASWSSYYVGDETAHGFLYAQGNSSASSPHGLFMYNSGNLTLGLTARAQDAYLGSYEQLTEEVLTSVSYEASWLEQPVVLHSDNISDPNALSTFAYNLSLANIPEGHQQIIVTASEEGYMWNYTDYWTFSDSTSALLNFNVVPLSVSFISPVEGQVFNSTGTFAGLIPLVFNVNGAPTWLAYSLDDLASNEIDGNATLVGLANGHYSLTVYAEDSFGNIGKSETINFTVAEPEPELAHPFPTATVVSVVVVAVVGIGLAVLFYRRHRKTANLKQ